MFCDCDTAHKHTYTYVHVKRRRLRHSRQCVCLRLSDYMRYIWHNDDSLSLDSIDMFLVCALAFDEHTGEMVRFTV